MNVDYTRKQVCSIVLAIMLNSQKQLNIVLSTKKCFKWKIHILVCVMSFIRKIEVSLVCTYTS